MRPDPLPLSPTYRLIDLPVHRDERGALGFAQEGDQVPFPIKRIFYLYDFLEGETRGNHAHRKQHQFLMMFSGACTVTVDTGIDRQDVRLSSPSQGLYAPPMHWLILKDFSPNAVCGVLTSGLYDPEDYVRDYSEFKTLASGPQQQ